MYYLDTCMCVDFMRNKSKEAYAYMLARGPKEVKLPSIVVAELEYGVCHSAHRDKNREILDSFLDSFEIVPFDVACGKAYGKLRHYLAAKGKLIGPNDLLIASMALAHEAVLVTNNVDEFKRVPYLQIESWYELPHD